MAFPLNPTIGDTHVMGSKTYKWDGTVWSRSIDGLLTTSNITETDGNVFYSNTRVRNFLGNIDGALVPSTDEGFSLGTDLKKWSNLYLSGNTIVLGQTKIQSSGDGSIAIRSTNTQVTSTISFSSNGYIASEAGTYTTANVAEQGNLYFTNARAIAAFTAGAGISIAANGRVTSSGAVTAVAGQTGSISNAQLACAIVSTGLLTTANVSEVTNLYFTNTRAIYSLTAGSNISIAANGLITALAQGGGGSSTTDTRRISFVSSLLFGG